MAFIFLKLSYLPEFLEELRQTASSKYAEERNESYPFEYGWSIVEDNFR